MRPRTRSDASTGTGRGPSAWLRSRRLRRFAERIGTPIVPGNRVEVLIGGRDSTRAMLDAIRDARRSVAIEMYTWADDPMGRRFAEVLGARARNGIPVFVLVDAFGSLGSAGLLASLERAGARVVWYHPLAPWTPIWYPNRRNHRKLLLVDGVMAFTGGINLAACYSDEFVGREAWRDLMLRLEGPIVRRMARMFLATWVRSGGRPDAAAPLVALPAAVGRSRVQVVGGRGWKGRRTLRRSHLSLLVQARRHVFVANAYFAPEGWLRRALCRAARRGVRVEMLLPGKSDAPVVGWAGRATYRALLEAGVHIREMDQAVLHAKLAVFDGQVMLAGSANMDYRSFRHNQEMAVNVFDREAAATALRAFEAEFASSRPIRLEEWERRSWGRRLLERLAYSVRFWL